MTFNHEGLQDKFAELPLEDRADAMYRARVRHLRLATEDGGVIGHLITDYVDNTTKGE